MALRSSRKADRFWYILSFTMNRIVNWNQERGLATRTVGLEEKKANEFKR